MNKRAYETAPVLVAGDGKLAGSVSVCLLQAGHEVTLLTGHEPEAQKLLAAHLRDLREEQAIEPDLSRIQIVDEISGACSWQLAIVLTNENLADKKNTIQFLESILPTTAIIAINTESIALAHLQEGACWPRRIIGANWVEPAHTTCFLELISNETTNEDLVESLYRLARERWKKDPYWLTHGTGIRQRMMSALIREAFYLVENGYASIEDIDRACRNDAGYYLAFAGNCRYMDLMGTYAYGMVMKDLNKELANDQTVANFFTEIIENGGLGMQNNTGFYPYEEGEAAVWAETFRKFSYQIQQIIEKYPFNYKEEAVVLANSSH
ncbi:3-hydroxyacyl-CoA dehydrogenase family protein [Nibrella saemangeumensis]|uniref:3-hydroxyacyl-CoA dehydrogenase family protein n=1 Tax=Nibrella saemangeumensis TaxID=1084526 RepID=A0ABP8NEC2_9BACT